MHTNPHPAILILCLFKAKPHVYNLKMAEDGLSTILSLSTARPKV
jgi:hypothetical protein